MVKMTLKYRCGVYFIKNSLTLASLKGGPFDPTFSINRDFLCLNPYQPKGGPLDTTFSINHDFFSKAYLKNS